MSASIECELMHVSVCSLCVCALRELLKVVLDLWTCVSVGVKRPSGFLLHCIKAARAAADVLNQSHIFSLWPHLPLYSKSRCFLLFPSSTQLSCVVGSCVVNGFCLLWLRFWPHLNGNWRSSNSLHKCIATRLAKSMLLFYRHPELYVLFDYVARWALTLGAHIDTRHTVADLSLKGPALVSFAPFIIRVIIFM